MGNVWVEGGCSRVIAGEPRPRVGGSRWGLNTLREDCLVEIYRIGSRVRQGDQMHVPVAENPSIHVNI